MILRDRKLNIAPAIKKQTFVAPNETIYYAATTHPSLINNIPIEQFPQAAAELYSPGELQTFTYSYYKSVLYVSLKTFLLLNFVC